MANEEQLAIVPYLPLDTSPKYRKARDLGESHGMQSMRCEDALDRFRNLERQIAQADAEIDQRVYALYGLTEDEVKVVEGKE